MIEVCSQPRPTGLHRFDELSDEDGEALENFLSYASEPSIVGLALERAALFRFTSERDEHGNHLPRSFAMPTEPVMSSDGKHRIGTRPVPVMHVKAESPATRYRWEQDGSEPSFEPSMEEAETRAFVSLRFKRMANAGNSFAVEALSIHRGAIGHYFSVGAINEDTGRPVVELPRLYSLLHVVPSGRQLLELAPRPGIAPRWKDRVWAQLTALERTMLKREQPLLWTRMRTKPADELINLPEYGQMRIHAAELSPSKVRKDYRPHRPLFAGAVEEARELYAASCVAWNEAGRLER